MGTDPGTLVHKFQVTPLHEGRPLLDKFTTLRIPISSHAPTRGATASRERYNITFFISSHAPTRGATHQRGGWHSRVCISSHAPARGATRRTDFAAGQHSISSHAPARGATEEIDLEKGYLAISSHAPARGATGKSRRKPRTAYFKSRPCTRGDVLTAAHGAIPKLFQVTPLHEGRLCILALSFFVGVHFKSRPCTRGDWKPC